MSSPGPLHTPPASGSADTSRSCHHRCHRHRRPQRNRHRTPPRRPAGFRRSRSRRLECRSITLVDARQGRCTRHKRRCSNTFVDVVANAIGILVRAQSPPHTSKGVQLVSFDHSRLLGCLHIRTRRSRREPLHTPQASVPNAVVVVIIADAIGILVHQRNRHRTRPGRRAGFHHSRNRRLGCRSIHTRRSRQGRCTPQRRVRPRGRPRHRRCHRHLRPQRNRHRTRRASSWLPSQSQSPAGMSEHPHS